MKRIHQAGFTIVELLVVVGIMALLASITLPVIMSMSRNTRYNNCMDNLREIGVALALYRSDYGYYPAAPQPKFLQSQGQDWRSMPYSTTQLSFDADALAISKESVTFKHDVDLEAKMPVLLTDTRTGTAEDAVIDTVAAGTVTFTNALRQTYTEGGVLQPKPIAIVGRLDGYSVVVKRTDGLHEGMRVMIKRDGSETIEQPMIESIGSPDVNNNNAVTITFADKFSAYLQHHSGDTLEPAVGNFGLATLYFLYYNDEKNYMRSYQRYHCPELRAKATVDRNAIIKAVVVNSPETKEYRTFDPLWAGYNTYDLTYNYDQYSEGLAEYDDVMGYGNINSQRQLRNPTPPVDTVVCWCYGHSGAERPDGVNVESATGVTGATKAETEETRFNKVRLVLWVDGSVGSVRPYLVRSQAKGYYWVPSFLYTPGDGRK